VLVILEQAFFAPRRIWTSRAKCRVVCDTLIARLARFLTKLHHYRQAGDLDDYNRSMYSAQLLDHFQNPRNAGELAGANAVAEIDNPVCGDVLRLTLSVTDRRIVDIRFKAKGCVASMACASALTELSQGKTLDEALALSREQVVTAVGGLPHASTHAAQLALDALHAALRSVRS
jgi:nitrogen fixation protein NifU and related proteins